ncbi:VOC family protein [Agrobacterium larrymoorei]|uniref:Catechol 2,3-dioxygenase-like lactoylglutathione lyase family enzyme n=1 Tax=Agrobacterium larrymoorei TaxID=160699 RepID=A0ABU0UK15_9HYPH|nr:VOC family protein [Agrobacterium larrymoorei]MDQ1185153.1 catechol 2,3-dioxygenase-like lactoylglutathione lyase family enzyme [Agrobacterium larrymoorei]
MTLLRLDHIQLAMPEGGEQRARAFYADLLGLEEVEKPANLAGRGGCWFALGEVRVHLGVAADFVAARKAHPAFVVDDLAQLRKRLETAGCHVVEDEPLEGYHRFYVYDPFGNRIEMMQPLEP